MVTNILIIILYIAAFALIQRRISKLIYEFSANKHINATRSSLVSIFISFLLFFITVSMMALSLGLGYQDVSLFVSSAFAVLGVALFAQWSILSNLTAGILIFFISPYKLGERIRIVDADVDASGTLEEVTLFHLLIKLDNGDIITYPNTLALTKPVVKLTKSPESHTAVEADTSTSTTEKLNS